MLDNSFLLSVHKHSLNRAANEDTDQYKIFTTQNTVSQLKDMQILNKFNFEAQS